VRQDCVASYTRLTVRDAALLQPDEADNLHVQFRSGPNTLIARRIEGSHPNYRCVVPHEFLADATIPETHRPALISWLRSRVGKANSVRLTCENVGLLTSTHRDAENTAATIQVPCTIAGHPPAISFGPQYLADALVIGSTLRLSGGRSRRFEPSHVQVVHSQRSCKWTFASRHFFTGCHRSLLFQLRT